MTTDEIIIINCAFRYALGRRTYVVSIIANKLISLYPEYPVDQQRKTAEEIKEAIKKGHAGSDHDAEEWKKVMCLFTPELHFKGKAYIDEDNYENHEAVLVDGVYYDLDMKRYFHTFKANE